MESKKITVAMDVGTTKVCTVIASKSKNELQILGVGSHPSHGLKKGSVVNIEKTVQSITASLNEAKLMSGLQDLTEVTVGIAGNHIFCFNSSGVIPIKNKEIQASDVERVLEAAKAVLMPTDREVLHVIAQEFKVDNTTGIKDPIGMCGSRLEVFVHIVTGKKTLIHNLTKCLEMSGLKANKIILQPIASSKAVLTPEELDLGVVLIDIGGGTTDLAVWKDGALIHSQIIPIGGHHFTNDLAIALKIPHSEAEKCKIQHGQVIARSVDSKVHVSVQGLTGTRPKEIALKYIAEVLEARAEEMFEVIQKVLEEQQLQPLINGGFVLTGGGALIKGLAELAEYHLERPVKIGTPKSIGGIGRVMQDPKYATALGLLIEGQSYQVQMPDIKVYREANERGDSRRIPSDSVVGGLKQSMKNLFNDLF